MKMKSAEFIALSACTMMLTALGIDIMLPAFSEIRKHFGLAAESNATAQIIVFFFMGQIAQLVFGALSDRFGRLIILRIGFPLYIIGGIAATYAPSLSIMLVARFIAGMGASAVFMTAIAGVRDRFVGDKMASILSLIFTIFLFTPVFAPFLGLAILSFSTWRAVFLTPPLFAVVVFVWSLRMEESLPLEKRSKLNWNTISQSIRSILSNSVFLRYTAVTTFLFTGLSSWVSSSEHILGEIYGRPELFAWIFASVGFIAALSALTNSRLSSKFGARRTIRGLLIVYSLVGALLLACTFAWGDPPQMTLFFIAIALLVGLNLAVEPNSSALAMEPMGDRAGMASAIYGTSFFFIGAALGSFISNLLANTVFPLIASFFLIGIVTLALVFGDKRPSTARS
ncbi:multidrug effflux MFS transporter [Olivibacter sp. LS-1]|uniref:MFS transporter n=1 Tax=unclassified Olivibacter TaxID=2632301 RepID=UPI0011EAE1B9|nr:MULTISPECIES: MFS transporter [unclassified Olivibacter]MDM8177883.1 MFS transporter [Olivibacter sp. 47]QEK99572.1 multidrug effflux MFS transporter [Olivibacter sp. LS-1]